MGENLVSDKRNAWNENLALSWVSSHPFGLMQAKFLSMKTIPKVLHMTNKIIGCCGHLQIYLNIFRWRSFCVNGVNGNLALGFQNFITLAPTCVCLMK